jgi:hypothetical protein
MLGVLLLFHIASTMQQNASLTFMTATVAVTAQYISYAGRLCTVPVTISLTASQTLMSM